MRYNYCRPKDIVDAHVADEQIHGLLEALAPKDQHHQADVGHYDEDVDEEEEDEGGNKGLGGYV